eukprot:COSAG02_NODE_3445_length_6730_cov_4.938772_2_plen_234_part_00
MVTKRRVMAGDELLFDYGRAYWKKAYFFANSFAQTPADAVAENSAEASESSAAQIDKVLDRLNHDPRLLRCCYRVVPQPDGDGSCDDNGLVYFLMDEVGSRVRTITDDKLATESVSSDSSKQPGRGDSGAEQCCESDESPQAKDEANEANESRLDRVLKLNVAEVPPESIGQEQPEPASEDPQQAEAVETRRRPSKMARVGMALLHHMSEGVMYSLLWLREDAAEGAELISVV